MSFWSFLAFIFVTYAGLCLFCLAVSWFEEKKITIWPLEEFPLGFGLFLLLPVLYVIRITDSLKALFRLV